MTSYLFKGEKEKKEREKEKKEREKRKPSKRSLTIASSVSVELAFSFPGAQGVPGQAFQSAVEAA